MSLNNENADRRKEPRYEIWSDVKVMTPENIHIAAAKNISGGGMEIQLSKCINPNIQLTVSLKLHDEFIFRGTVVWTLGDYIDGGWIYRVGIKTKQITSKNGIARTSREKRELVERILPHIPNVRVNKTLEAQIAA